MRDVVRGAIAAMLLLLAMSTSASALCDPNSPNCCGGVPCPPQGQGSSGGSNTNPQEVPVESTEHTIGGSPANVPELDRGGVVAGVTLLVGGLLLLTERRRLS